MPQSFFVFHVTDIFETYRPVVLKTLPPFLYIQYFIIRMKLCICVGALHKACCVLLSATFWETHEVGFSIISDVNLDWSLG